MKYKIEITHRMVIQAMHDIMEVEETLKHFETIHNGNHKKEMERFISKFFRYIEFGMSYKDMETDIESLMGSGSIYFTDEASSTALELYDFLSDVDCHLRKNLEANNE